MKFSFFSSKSLSLIIIKILFFLIVSLLSQAIDDKQYSECSKEFTCGSNTYADIKYPFWGDEGSSNCGLREYEVKCEKNDIYPVFEMGLQTFNVLSINRSSRLMTIVRVDLFDQGLCTDNLNNTVLDTSLVHYETGTQNITLFYSCQAGFLAEVDHNQKFSCQTYDDGVFSDRSWNTSFWLLGNQQCARSITIPVMGENLEKYKDGNLSLPDLVRKGFEGVYELRTEMVDLCNNCEDSGGVCGTDSTNQSICFCKDGTHIASCSEKSSNSTVGRNIGIEVPILVYEFISNGTLDEQLHNSKEDIMLNWKMRLQIAAETASTLSYLHNAVPKPIYHRDIKSSNILLDDKFKAKVADFGISRSVEIDVSHLTTLVRGTFGYLDPEYYHSCRFTEKSDVYSFGVVLVELLTGQKPIFSDTFGELKGSAPHFMGLMEENDFLKMIDPRLFQEDNTEEMIEVAYIAKACLDPIGKRRPTMKEVMVKLEGIKMSRKQSTHQENGKIDVGEAYDDSSSEMETWEESTTTSSHVVEMDGLP